jgi:hypothetical protein
MPSNESEAQQAQNDIDVAKSLGNIESKLDSILEILPDHETRLRSAERKITCATGIGSCITAILTFVHFNFKV